MWLLAKINDFYQKNKKNIFYSLLFIFIFIHWIDFTFAQNDTTLVAADSKSSFSTQMIDFLNQLLKVLAMVIGFITMVIGLFLRPEWTSWSVIWLDVQLKTMWIMISNIVYFIFAWIFIFIAFMNIIWDWEHYWLKKSIPKFIVWVLIVPFSWFFVQLILSLSWILTTVVLSIPYDTFPAIKEKNILVCKDWAQLNVSELSKNIECIWWDDNKEPKTISDFIKSSDNWWLYQIMFIYTYSVLRLDEVSQLKSQDLWWKGQITKLADVSLQFVFDMLFVFVYWILLIALFLAFVTRSFALWLYAMFSPAFWLLYFFWSEKSKNFNVKEFIWLAMVPVYVAWALSFWLLFLFVAWQWFSAENTSNKIFTFKDDKIVVWGEWPTSVTFTAIKSSRENLPNDLLAWFWSPVSAMFLELLGLVILWMWVMAALKQSTITESAAKPIAEFGKSIWELIKKAPWFTPIPWLWLSAQWLSQIWNAAKNYPEKISSKSAEDFMWKHKLFWYDGTSWDAKMWRITSSAKDGITNTTEAKEFKEAVQSFKSLSEMSNSWNARDVLSALLKYHKVNDAEVLVKNLNTEEWMWKALKALQDNSDYRNKAQDSALRWRNWVFNNWTDTRELFWWKPTTNSNIKNDSIQPWDNGKFTIYNYWESSWGNNAIIEVKNKKITDKEIEKLIPILKTHNEKNRSTWVEGILKSLNLDDETSKKILEELKKK